MSATFKRAASENRSLRMVRKTKSASPFNQNIRDNRTSDKATRRPQETRSPSACQYIETCQRNRLVRDQPQSRHLFKTSKEQSRLSSTSAVTGRRRVIVHANSARFAAPVHGMVIRRGPQLVRRRTPQPAVTIGTQEMSVREVRGVQFRGGNPKTHF